MTRDFGPMRPFGELLPIETALERLAGAVTPLDEAEAVPVAEAVGRIAAEQVAAAEPVPGFARAMMDGFAVRAEDLARAADGAPVTLALAGVVHAGARGGPVESGTCWQIATGGPLPHDADTVVPVEHTHRAGEAAVEFDRVPAVNANVAAAGNDLAAGDIAVEQGARCTPAICGAIASLGLARTWVVRRPRVSVWGSGDEVRPAGETLQFGQIHDSNGPTLGALAAQHGATTTLHGALPDDREALAALFDRPDADVIVLTGGTSVGERDLAAEVIGEQAELLFHGLAVKPGKPALAAMLGPKLVLGLPGNPTSCLQMSYLLLVPALRTLAGLPPWAPRTVTATLAGDVRSPAGKRHYYSVRLEGEQAVPAFRGSGAISSLSQADGWIEIPAEADGVAAGTPVTVRCFE